MDLVALKTEITTDPLALGYAAIIADHAAVAKLIRNSPRNVADNSDRPTWQLLAVMNLSEVVTVIATPAKAAMLQMICSMPTINPDDKGVKAWITSIFGSPSATLTAFNKFAKRTGSRAEELGFGRVTESDVADALLRT